MKRCHCAADLLPDRTRRGFHGLFCIGMLRRPVLLVFAQVSSRNTTCPGSRGLLQTPQRPLQRDIGPSCLLALRTFFSRCTKVYFSRHNATDNVCRLTWTPSFAQLSQRGVRLLLDELHQPIGERMPFW